MEHQQHFNRLLKLLKKEREEDRKQYEEKIRNRSLQDRKKEGVTWFPVSIEKSFLGTGEKWVLKISRTGTGQRHFFQSGSSASLFLTDEKLSTSGIVSQVNDTQMTLVLNSDDPPDWMDDGKIGVNLLFDEGTYEEMERTMKKLAHPLDGRLKELVSVLLGHQAPHFATGQKEFVDPALNESQNKALQLIRATADIGLVHGPPGTGKTTTLSEAILLTVGEEKQVLVSASSNTAVDLLTEKLTERGLRVLRLGHPARVTEQVVASTLDARLAEHADAKLLRDLRRKSEELRDVGKKYKRNFGPAERTQRKLLLDEARNLKDEANQLEGHLIFDELNKAQVVACTFVGANNPYLFNRTFKTLFIDEASQALEPANWIPILKANRVIMAGDHWQLPPTVKSREAEMEGLGKTIFERMIHGNPQASVMLETQYRMNPEIVKFSNQYFYEGKLKSAELISRRRIIFNEPLVFIDTAGCGFEEKLNQETLSTYNEEEASFLLKQLDRMIQEKPEEFQRLKVGIIAPYKAQTEVIRGLLPSYEWFTSMQSHLSVHSVDGFQGQERDVMLISLVRSNPKGEIGFLADIRRMNVAMTRARHHLRMVGDSATLSNHPFFDQLIQDIQGRGYYKSAFEFMY